MALEISSWDSQCWCSSRFWIKSAFIPNMHQGHYIAKVLAYINYNYLFDNHQCNPKLFSDDTPLFSTVEVSERTANNLNNDLKEVNKWTFRWKMSFTPDPKKQAQ